MRISVILKPIFPLYKKPLLQAIKIWKKAGLNLDILALSPSLESRQTATVIRKKCIVKSKPQVLEIFHDPAALLNWLQTQPDRHVGLVCSQEEAESLLRALNLPAVYRLNPTGCLTLECNCVQNTAHITGLYTPL